jgi:CTP:phosphocholine cytidylyltransferase-like protein
MLITYVVVKRSHDESHVCWLTFPYVYNKYLTLIILVNNCMMSINNFQSLVHLNNILCNTYLG